MKKIALLTLSLLMTLLHSPAQASHRSQSLIKAHASEKLSATIQYINQDYPSTAMLTGNYTDFSGKWVGRCSSEKGYIKSKIEIINDETTITIVNILHEDSFTLREIFGPITIAPFTISRKPMEPTGDEVFLTREQLFWNQDNTELHKETLITYMDDPDPALDNHFIDYYKAILSDTVMTLQNDQLVTVESYTLLAGDLDEEYKETVTCVYTRSSE